jgi:predicted nucleic acid-binding Zn ribbon protein
VTKGRRDDPNADARRAARADLWNDPYARQRARQARARQKQDRQRYDPAPPSDEDWVVADEDTDGLRRITAPSPIGDALGALIQRRGWEERLRGSTAANRWVEVVGDDLASRCEPVRVAGGTLVVRAESQVWATQLKYLIPQLKENATRVLGEGTIRDVRLVVGPLEGTADRPQSEGPT